MTFLLRITLLGIAFFGSYVGGLSFDSGNKEQMVVGGLGVVVAIVCLFFLAKGLWRYLGCLMTLILVAVVVAALVFFMTSGPGLIKQWMDEKTAQIEASGAVSQPAEATMAMIDALSGGQPAEEASIGDLAVPTEPLPNPILKGLVVKVESGDSFMIGGRWVRLFGLAAPNVRQTCLDANGRSYNCGYLALRKLKELIGEDEPVCTVMAEDPQGNVVAACALGDTDIGAAMVEGGWAVALRNSSPIYIPYEDKARTGMEGMWAGKFYMPWDWEVLQRQQKENARAVKVPEMPKPKPKSTAKSIFNFL